MDKLRTEIITLANYADTSKDGKLSISGVFDEIFVDKLSFSLKSFIVLINNHEKTKIKSCKRYSTQ